MTKEQAMVREFHEKFGCTVEDRPKAPNERDAILRYELIREELAEFWKSCGYYSDKNPNLTEIADALADLLYVVYGSAVTCGIDLEPIFAEVHRSNMSKLHEGKVLRREDGKIIKSPNYNPANIGPLLEAQAL